MSYSGDIEDAVEIHNDTPYGLAGAIISEDYRQINYFRDYAEIGLAYAQPPVHRCGGSPAVRRREEVRQRLPERP